MERLFTPEIAVGYFQVTDLSAAISMTTLWAAAVAADSRITAIDAAPYVLLIDAEGGNIRWRNDLTLATAITGATGARLIQDTQLVYTASTTSLAGLQFIQETGFTSVKMNVQIFRNRA